MVDPRIGERSRGERRSLILIPECDALRDQRASQVLILQLVVDARWPAVKRIARLPQPVQIGLLDSGPNARFNGGFPIR
jgi:hypothetical protein